MNGVPVIDRRRAQALRAALAQMAPWLAPEWAGLGQDGDFGAALYEIAARLAEHSTRRLDQTPLRDKLAFLDTLDIAAPAPQPATVPIVFVLAEKRSTPVYAPPRVQIAAAGDGAPVIFETREAIAITPARPLRLIAADPAADRIELAPAPVVAVPHPSPPPVTYRLVSAAEPGGTMLQLAQAVGLAGGDLLRIRGAVYRIANRAGEIVTLLDRLEAPAPAGAAVEKVSQLDSFALRNLSEHVAYVGHKALLKLDGPATIALRLDPPSLVRRLAQLDIAYDLWGKRKGDDAAAWQPLIPLGGRDGDLRLSKDWEGAVEEVEAEGRKSRWIRLRLLTPIADSAPPDTRVASVALKVNSNPAPAAGATEGSRSIVSAFYNGLPLPLTTAFLPFGPEPQRFDTFAIAAPEALSKKGAAAELAVTLSDASLAALAYAEGAPDRVYGIGSNGRLQAIRFAGGETPAWRQLDRPPAAAGGGSAPRLDGKAPFLAFHAPADPANDLVLATDTSGAHWLALAAADGSTRAARKWARVEPPQDPPTSLCFVADSALGPLSLVASDSTGLSARTIDPAALSLGQPLPLGAAAGSATPHHPLVLATVRGAPGRIVAIDQDGKLFAGTIAAGAIAWEALATQALDRTVPPAASAEDGELTVAAAAKSGATVLMRDGKDRSPGARDPIVHPFALACLPPTSDSRFPLVAAIGTGGILLWTDEMLGPPVPLPPGTAEAKICALVRPGAGIVAPSVLIGTADELLLEAPIASSVQTFPIARFDALWLDAASASAAYFVPEGAAAQPIPAQRIGFGASTAVPLPPGAAGEAPTLLIPQAPAFTGARVAGDAQKLVLDKNDAVTGAGNLIEIGESLAEVVAIAKDPELGMVASFAADLPPRFIKYRSLAKSDPVKIAARDRGTLVRLAGASLPKDITSIRFGDPVSPTRQSFARATDAPAGDTWLRLGKAWTKAPEAASLQLPSLPGIKQWSQMRLPRSTENPDLSWEYFDGRGWRRLDAGFVDGTANLASTGTISFTVPDDLAPTDVAGKQDYWIRARLVGGDYGQPSYIVETSGTQQSIRVDRSALNPPEIVTIEASYALNSYTDPELVLTVNNLAARDQTQAAAAAGAAFDLFEGLAAHSGDPAGLGRAIYLGLTRAPGVDPLSLYVDAADKDAAPLRLQAEVLRPEGWAPIVCDDGTAGLTRPGLLRLFLSTAPAQLPLFGCDGWWLRLRPLEPTSTWAPIVGGLYLNAVTAEQAKSLRQEILGSSLGAPDQSYAFAEAPVLPDTVELRVRESLSDEERVALKATDSGAIASYPDIEGEWIRWCAADSFVDQGGAARVFRLNPSTGEIRFGDGRDGKIPPAGRDAIRAIAYQAGGGSRGNVPAFAVNQLKTALESVELAVNPVDAGGGADAPPQERLAETAPARLRHAARALTPPDIEALATGSSPDVVRARCLRGRGCGIDLVVAIRTGERCPIPSRARREGISRNIAAAGWGALTPEAIRVRAPRYVHIKVEAVVIAARADGVAQIENDVRNAIVAFLHPTDGGPRGLGWPFGRRPWPSDVQRVAAAVPGVDRVVDVAIATRDACGDLDRLGADALVCAEEDDIALIVQPPRSGR